MSTKTPDTTPLPSAPPQQSSLPSLSDGTPPAAEVIPSLRHALPSSETIRADLGLQRSGLARPEIDITRISLVAFVQSRSPSTLSLPDLKGMILLKLISDLKKPEKDWDDKTQLRCMEMLIRVTQPEKTDTVETLAAMAAAAIARMKG